MSRSLRVLTFFVLAAVLLSPTHGQPTGTSSSSISASASGTSKESLSPPKKAYDRWNEMLHGEFPNEYPHFDPHTPGDVRLSGDGACCACEIVTERKVDNEVTIGRSVELFPGIKLEGALIATRTKSGADLWYVNWNGWAHMLGSIKKQPTSAAYAPVDDGGVALLAGPDGNNVDVHALKLTFQSVKLSKDVRLHVPRLAFRIETSLRAPGKVDRVKVLHVGYEKVRSSWYPLFLILYTVNVAGKPTEEYGSDLYSALVRVDPEHLSVEVVPGSVVNDLCNVIAFDADVLWEDAYVRSYPIGNGTVYVFPVAVAYAREWRECSVRLTILMFSPSDREFLPTTDLKMSDEDCRPPVGNVLVAHVTPNDSTTVFLVAWTDGRDPIQHLRKIWTQLPSGKVTVQGTVIWCQSAVLTVKKGAKSGTVGNLCASVENKPAAIVPKGAKPVALLGLGTVSNAQFCLFWLDVVENDGIRSFPIPVYVTASSSTPCVFTVTVKSAVIGAFGTLDSRASGTEVPNVPIPSEKDPNPWIPWIATLNLASENVKSAMVVPIGSEQSTLVQSVKGKIPNKFSVEKGTMVVYQDDQGTFAAPTCPVVWVKSLIVGGTPGGYYVVLPLRYRMLKTILSISGPTIVNQRNVWYRLVLSQGPTSMGLFIAIVTHRGKVVGAALVKIGGSRVVGGDVKYVQLVSSNPPTVDVEVEAEENGEYEIEAFFADDSGEWISSGAYYRFIVRVPSGGPAQVQSSDYLPPGPGLHSSGGANVQSKMVSPAGNNENRGIRAPVPVVPVLPVPSRRKVDSKMRAEGWGTRRTRTRD